MPGKRGASRGEEIRESDVRALLDFVTGLVELESPEQFRAGVLPGLREFVPCEIATYNEVDFGTGAMIGEADPHYPDMERNIETFARLGQQNPLVQLVQRTRDGRPYKWSDLITRRELHRLDLYRELYGPLGIEFQMAMALPSPPEQVIGLAFNRTSRDFSERDRRLLNLVRSPLLQAYRTVDRYAELRERLEALERGMEDLGTGVVLLESRGGGLLASRVSEQAGLLLGLNGDGDRYSSLPDPLDEWLESLSASSDPLSHPPLVLGPSGSSRVVVRLLPARHSGELDALLVSREADLLDPTQLQATGLTARQAEVLRLVALGKTDAQIAADLELSVRTVQKHLENTYERLGAASRTQAVLTALSLARGSRPEMPAS